MVLLFLWRDNSGWVHLVQLVLVDIGMLDAMHCLVLQILEELVKRVLDGRHHTNTSVLVHVVVVAASNLIGVVHGNKVMISHMRNVEATLVSVFRSVHICVFVHVVGHSVSVPVIGTVFDSMGVVMLIHMLWVMLTIVTVRVVVAEVMVTLWLDVMVLSMFFSSEMSLIVKMRNMVLQLPIALLEMSIWVMFVAMDELFHVREFVSMSELIRCQLTVDMVRGHVVLDAVRNFVLAGGARFGFWLGLCLWLSLRLSLGWLWVEIWVVRVKRSVWIIVALRVSWAWEMSRIGTVAMSVAVRVVCIWVGSIQVTRHRTIVLRGCHIGTVIWGRFGPDSLEMRRLESMDSVALLDEVRLHLKYQVAILDVGL